MTTDICTYAEIGTTQQLTDIRDGKKYWVEKMANGGCWMLQNLDYVITSEMITNNEINSRTTDLHASNRYKTETDADGTTVYIWNSSSTYPPQATDVITGSTATVAKVTNNNAGTYSWNFGPTFWMDPFYITACSNTTNLHNCSDIATLGIYTKTDWSYAETGKVFDSTTRAYDAHFSIGSYYQFNTITAGSAAGNSNSQMNSSLCPKGWLLPLGSSSSRSDAKFLYGLLTTYGYSTGRNGTHDGKTRSVSQDPIYLVRSGYVLASAANPVQYARSRGYLWTGYGGTTAQGYYARVSGISLTRSSVDSRYYGLPARCVAR